MAVRHLDKKGIAMFITSDQRVLLCSWELETRLDSRSVFVLLLCSPSGARSLYYTTTG